VADLKRGPIRVAWPLTVDFLRGALRGTDATPTGDGTLEVELASSGSRVVVRGRASAQVSMPCASTLEPVPVALSPEIFLALSQAPGAGAALRHGRAARSARGGGRHRSADWPQTKATGWAADPVLSDDLAAEDLYHGEQVVLDDFVREFLLLELPMTVRGSGLPLAEDAAIRPPSRSEDAAALAAQRLDPRLLPLAAIASRMRKDKE